MKTKLGISVGLLGALTYFMGLFTGYSVLILVVGYILICEDNGWLRRSAVKALVICVAFSVISALVGFIPSLIGIVDDVCRIFNGHFYPEVINEIVNLFNSVLYLLEKVLFLVLGAKALHQGSVAVNVVDKLVDEHMKAE